MPSLVKNTASKVSQAEPMLSNCTLPVQGATHSYETSGALEAAQEGVTSSDMPVVEPPPMAAPKVWSGSTSDVGQEKASAVLAVAREASRTRAERGKDPR